ncbi:MAG: hypothetical protein ABI726_09825 [bacterium]
MQDVFPIIFLAVILKIPVALLLYLVWWAFHAEPEVEQAPPDADDHRFRRFRRDPRGPDRPRRGPHSPTAQPLPGCPPTAPRRVLVPPAPARAATASARKGRGVAERP